MSAQPATTSGLVSWTPPADNGGSSDHRLHRDAVHRLDRADTDPCRRGRRPARLSPVCPTATATRSLSLRRTRSGTARSPSASAAIQPQDTIFDFTAPLRDVDSGDGNPVELGVKFTVRRRRRDHRHPLLQGRTNTGTHIGSLWTSHRHATRSGDVHQRDRFGLADGATSPTRSTSPPERPTWPPTSRRSATTRSHTGGFSSAVDNPPLHASRTQPAPTASTRTARRARSRPTASTRRTTGSTCCSAGQRTGTGHRRDRHGRQSSRATVSWTAPQRWHRDLELHDHARTSARRRRPPTLSSAVTSGDEHDDHRPHHRYDVHVHSAGLQPLRHRACVRPFERGHAGAERPRPRRRPACLPQPGDAPRRRQLDARRQRRRQPDHRLHDHPVHRLDRADTDAR